MQCLYASGTITTTYVSALIPEVSIHRRFGNFHKQEVHMFTYIPEVKYANNTSELSLRVVTHDTCYGWAHLMLQVIKVES